MSHTIIKTDSGKYALFVCGEFIFEYTRKFSAKRGLSRIVKRMQAILSQLQG